MLKAIAHNLNPRSTLLGALCLVLSLSLVCSLSIRHGHADVPVAPTAEETQPLAVGDPAPRFEVRTVSNERFVFDPRELDNPALIITFRGGWCPFCNLHLSELHAVVPAIDALGVDVLFLSGDRPGLLYESLSHETRDTIADLDYTILSDADAQAAIAFGIAFKATQSTIDRRRAKGQDIEYSSMARHGVLPVPSVFAVGRDGVIAFAYSEPNYRVRLAADELMAVAEDIAAAE